MLGVRGRQRYMPTWKHTFVTIVFLICICCTTAQNRDLVSAAAQGNTEVVKALLARGANIEAHANDDWTPLTIASREGHLETVRVLLESGARVDSHEGGGNTAL